MRCHRSSNMMFSAPSLRAAAYLNSILPTPRRLPTSEGVNVQPWVGLHIRLPGHRGSELLGYGYAFVGDQVHPVGGEVGIRVSQQVFGKLQVGQVLFVFTMSGLGLDIDPEFAGCNHRVDLAGVPAPDQLP